MQYDAMKDNRFASYFLKRKKKRLEWSKNANEAKRQKRLLSSMPDRPADMKENWVNVKIERCINGHIQIEEYFGDGISWNSYVAWKPETSECLGIMSLRKIVFYMLKPFVRIKA